ncbi:MAG: lipoprotein 17-related variable surface protein [Metamycoplasmataceae bacterium]
MKKKYFIPILTPIMLTPIILTSCSNTNDNSFNDKQYNIFNDFEIKELEQNYLYSNLITNFKSLTSFYPEAHNLDLDNFIPDFQYKYSPDFSSVNVDIILKNLNGEEVPFSQKTKTINISGFSKVEQGIKEEINEIYQKQHDKAKTDSFLASTIKKIETLPSNIKESDIKFDIIENYSIEIANLIPNDNKGTLKIVFEVFKINNQKKNLINPFFENHNDVNTQKTIELIGFQTTNNLQESIDNFYENNFPSRTYDINTLLTQDGINIFKNQYFPSSFEDTNSLKIAIKLMSENLKNNSDKNNFPKPLMPDFSDNSNYYWKYNILSRDLSREINVEYILVGKDNNKEYKASSFKSFSINFPTFFDDDSEQKKMKELLKATVSAYDLFNNSVLYTNKEESLPSINSKIDLSTINFDFLGTIYDKNTNILTIEIESEDTNTPSKKIIDKYKYKFKIELEAITTNESDQNKGTIKSNLRLFYLPVESNHEIFIRPPSFYISDGVIQYNEAQKTPIISIGGYSISINNFITWYDEIKKEVEKIKPQIVSKNIISEIDENNILEYLPNINIPTLNEGLTIKYKVMSKPIFSLEDNKLAISFNISYTIVSLYNDEIIFLPDEIKDNNFIFKVIEE